MGLQFNGGPEGLSIAAIQFAGFPSPCNGRVATENTISAEINPNFLTSEPIAK